MTQILTKCLSTRWLCASMLAFVIPQVMAAGRAKHVVLITWDGLRPDAVSAAITPNLENLRESGTFFSRHHAVYPSTTEVNGTALATGMYPANSGIMGNNEYRPRWNVAESFGTESLKGIRKGDQLTGGKYLAVPTMYEMLQAAGSPTVVAGTKGVAVLPDRSQHRPRGAAADSVNVFAGQTLPPKLLGMLKTKFGTFPEKPTFPDVAQNQWTVDVLLQELWKTEVPKLTLLWLSDPDYSQHHTQPGSSVALAALRENDRMLAQVLAKLEEKGVREDTDILLVSDHGFSTIDKTMDFASLLSQAGFRASRKFLHKPDPGEILVVGNGGSVFFYVIGHEKETQRRLVEFLQTCNGSGVIFCSRDLPGTFPLAAVHIDTPEAPDVVLSMRWNSSPNPSGVDGLLVADTKGARKPGQGMHGSLSPFDMHNTLIASGPDFRRGYVDELPSGNIDVAPTILWILGVTPDHRLDGRVLVEALKTPPFDPPKLRQKTLRATSANGGWRQYLRVSSMGNTDYFDRGNTSD